MCEVKAPFHTKSYTAISEIFGPTPFNNVLYQNSKGIDQLKTGVTESDLKSILKNSVTVNEMPFVTCENFHGLNKYLSYMSLVQSTSTIFCDLDEIANRHSFHCLTEVGTSNNPIKIRKQKRKTQVNEYGFKGKADTVVQECATQIHPKLLAKDSLEVNSRKVKRSFQQNDNLSSEICLRDPINYARHKNHYYNIDVTNNHKKFWSYAKIRSEYTKPEEKKIKKKERVKRSEDPCPCQLFSYACPCSDEKSLTKLAKGNKGFVVIDQNTSTALVNTFMDKKHEVRDDKNTGMSFSSKGKGAANPSKEPSIVKKDIPVLIDNNISCKYSPRRKQKPKKRTHKLICPNCKQKVEVQSTTEEEEILKSEDSYRSKESKHFNPTAYNCSTSPPNYNDTVSSKGNKSKIDDGDVCDHQPRCGLVPVCQILPTETGVNTTSVNKKPTSGTPIKSGPRVIRITKACRHHPPCTVVPSCQRANVLRNNCEFIPPCLHRPRCVNLPLCVPFSKSINYEDLCQHEAECSHSSRSKYIATSQHGSIENLTNHHYNMIAQVQNACEFINEYRTWPYKIRPRSQMSRNQISNMSPVLVSSPCGSCLSNKSCQFDCLDCCVITTVPKESASRDAIVFIRDVGCQFKSKMYSPKDSVVRSGTSNAFDLVNVNTGNYYSVGCEDKSTNAKSKVESTSTDSVISDIDLQSHGRHTQKTQGTGFNPNQRYVTAIMQSDKFPSLISERCKSGKSDTPRYRCSTFPVKSRRSFLKGKYRKIFSSRRRKISKTSSLIMTVSEKSKIMV